MMTNLFSIFDPSTPPLMSTNWASIILPILLLPPKFWSNHNPNSLNLPNLLLLLHKEIKNLTSPMYAPGSSLILLSIMWFILVNNLMGLLPHVFTATSHLIISLCLSLLSWTTIMLFGWINNTNHMFSHLLPLGTPNILALFMICVETISNIIRPITLAVRLTANMIAGHLIMTLLSSCFSLSLTNNLMIFIPESLLIILESAVAIIQAYVFMTLLTLYSSEIH